MLQLYEIQPVSLYPFGAVGRFLNLVRQVIISAIDMRRMTLQAERLSTGSEDRLGKRKAVHRLQTTDKLVDWSVVRKDRSVNIRKSLLSAQTTSDSYSKL